MKKVQPLKPPSPAQAADADAKQAEVPKSMDLGLIERRRTIRPLPVPEAVESDGDTAWGDFQALISDDSDK